MNLDNFEYAKRVKGCDLKAVYSYEKEKYQQRNHTSLLIYSNLSSPRECLNTKTRVYGEQGTTYSPLQSSLIGKIIKTYVSLLQVAGALKKMI